MRLSQPRIPPVQEADWTEEQRRLLEPSRGREGVLNVFKTLANHPAAMAAFMPWGRYVLGPDSALGARERELVVLRIGWLCRSGYEWTQHVRVGTRCGLSDAEIARIKLGPADPAWGERDAALLHAADELHADRFVRDATWARLQAHYDDRGCMDVVFAAAQYTQVCMMLNSFGVPLDPGQTLDPDLDHRPA